MQGGTYMQRSFLNKLRPNKRQSRSTSKSSPNMPTDNTMKADTNGQLSPDMVLQLQRTIGNHAVTDLVSSKTIYRQSDTDTANNTGLPDHLKSNVEQMSGISMDDVKVHYNSTEPERMGAAAYTEGSDIHIGSGQESYLPHEAWHVVQQKQGRVTPSIQMKSFSANFDDLLEHEADVMGAKANQPSLASRLPSTEQVVTSNQALGQHLAQRTATPVRQYGGCKGGSSKKSKLPGTDIGDPKSELAMTKDHWASGWTARNVGVIDKIADSKALLDIAEKGEITDVELAMDAQDMLHEQGIALTKTKQVQMYKITDTSKKFYTATHKNTAPLIAENGLDPQYGGSTEENQTSYNSIGHIYFGTDKSTAEGYGILRYGSKSKMRVIEFTLPSGHPVSVDPEVSGSDSATAFRTPELVPASLITVLD